jgi:hypothetical protein
MVSRGALAPRLVASWLVQDPDSTRPPAQSGFDDRAEAAADRNDPSYDGYDDYGDME